MERYRVQITDEIEQYRTPDLTETKRQKHETFTINKIIWYLKSYYICNGYMPSVREITKYMGVAKGTIQYWLDVMEAKDLITKDYAVARSIRIVHWDADKAVKTWKKISKKK